MEIADKSSCNLCVFRAVMPVNWLRVNQFINFNMSIVSIHINTHIPNKFLVCLHSEYQIKYNFVETPKKKIFENNFVETPPKIIFDLTYLI